VIEPVVSDRRAVAESSLGRHIADMDPEKVNYHYCDDLLTRPRADIRRILVTGANGYVAHRLIPELVHRGYRVRCMVRNRHTPTVLTHPLIEYVFADCLCRDELAAALKDVDVAYYLIHSMRLKKEEFQDKDLAAARNFSAMADACGLKQVIYLGGLGEIDDQRMSEHLRSRMEVGNTLARGKTPVVRLRAGIIIGTGSASFELMKSLVLHTRWVPFLAEFNSKCQPIAIRDVIRYMVGVLENPDIGPGTYAIGGPDVFTYKEILRRVAGIYGCRVRFIDVSWIPLPIGWLCRIFAHWLALFVTVPVNIISLLLNSLKTDVVCTTNEIMRFLPFEPMGFDTAVRWVQEKEKNAQVYSHWGGVRPDAMQDLMPLCEYEASTVIVDEHCIRIPAPPEKVFDIVRRVGGEFGWVHANTLWQIRGSIDKVLGGVGLSRGRRDPHRLRVGDAVDFWRVEKLEPGRELLLRAELLSPGLSWLQFVLETLASGDTLLTLRAHFIPLPFWGRIYWAVLSKFHDYIFMGMLDFFYRESLKKDDPAHSAEASRERI
jgi:uncharacterized protein YbjT (DUF2867 family)